MQQMGVSSDLPPLALSVRQPMAYLAGCLLGDACLTTGHKNSVRGYLQLRVADWDFANAFSSAIYAGFGVIYVPRKDERGYALVRTYNGFGRFDVLRGLIPSLLEEKAAWLRGLFDSEGNVVCVPKPYQGPRSWDRRIAFFSTNQETLHMGLAYLADLKIVSVIRGWPPSDSHHGSKPVFALLLKNGRENYASFARDVGSSIARKSDRINKLPETYHPDLSDAYREAQLKGAAVRNARKLAGGKY